jgi:hypothetical protein
MPPKSIDNVRKPGRPAVNAAPYTVRVPPALDAKIDRWIGKQPDKPSKPEAIRRLVEKGLGEG